MAAIMAGSPFSALDMQGKVALVTGAGRGIGQATAMLLARRGAAVMVADIDGTAAQATAQAISANHGRAAHLAIDMTDEDQVADMIDQTVRMLGGLHAAFNNAGIARVGPLLAQAPLSDWQQTIDVNLKGVFLCLKYQTRHMAESGGGAIVNASSCAALLGQQRTAAYCASKAGVIGLTRAAMAEYGPRRIRVNAIAPGSIDTPMLRQSVGDDDGIIAALGKDYPLGRIGHVDDVAETAAWLLSDAASFVTGICLAVDGGYTSSGPWAHNPDDAPA